SGIVVVTTAYRLGVFGVMALGDEYVLPANLAFHDILAALKFTRREIGHFGGDKDKVTLLGHSTGAQMALMAAFSPGISKPDAKRLFSGIISMSGPGVLETQEQTVSRTHALTTELGCEGSASEIMVCLRLLDTKTIVDASVKVAPFGITMAGELFPIQSEQELMESKEPIRVLMGTTIYEFPGPSIPGETRMVRLLDIVNVEECSEKYRARLQFRLRRNHHDSACVFEVPSRNGGRGISIRIRLSSARSSYR
ncbi:hypothetical protein PENTCL1PPCAC_28158, partial [Pristionchus entomophagus]